MGTFTQSRSRPISVALSGVTAVPLSRAADFAAGESGSASVRYND
nr:hypothetical protein [Pantoea vagans]